MSILHSDVLLFNFLGTVSYTLSLENSLLKKPETRIHRTEVTNFYLS